MIGDSACASGDLAIVELIRLVAATGERPARTGQRDAPLTRTGPG